MLTGKELGDALADAIRKKGVSKAEVARHFGVTPPSVQDWIKYGRISKIHLQTLLTYFSDVVGPEHWGFNPSTRSPVHGIEAWSDTDYYEAVSIYNEQLERTGDPDKASKVASEIMLSLKRERESTTETPHRHQMTPLEAWDDATPLHSDDIELPFFKEVCLSAGDGCTHAVEVGDRKLRFARSTLKAAGVDIESAICATATGNSMEDIIHDGTTIGIDRARTQIKDGKIYAIDHDGMLRVKYVYRLPGGGLRLRSHNSDEYQDEVYTGADAAKIKILGWVFWWSTIATW